MGGMNNLENNSSGSDSELENHHHHHQQQQQQQQPMNNGNNQLDAIAGAIMQQFPSIQEILNNDPDLN